MSTTGSLRWYSAARLAWRCWIAATAPSERCWKRCGDADDVFFDPRRLRIYVSCGSGYVVFEGNGSLYRAGARIATAAGARTSLFVPQLDRLIVAERAGLLGSEAALLVFRPNP